jgi:hypothetical protein
MTKQEAAIATAFTGMLFGEFGDFHEYAEKLLERPILTHEFGTSATAAKIKELARPDFIAMNEAIKEHDE